MIVVTAEQLERLGAKKSSVYLKYSQPLNEAMVEYDITSNNRICHFLPQLFHESRYLQRSKESLFYTTPERLLEVFPKYIKTREQALKYVNNPEALGNLVYGGRLGNNKDEGFKYCGRGLIQLTGKENYQKCSEALGIDFVSNPELLEQPKYAALSSAWFWHKNNLNNEVDKHNSVERVTRVVNGGLNGLEDRIKLYNKARGIWK